MMQSHCITVTCMTIDCRINAFTPKRFGVVVGVASSRTCSYWYCVDGALLFGFRFQMFLPWMELIYATINTTATAFRGSRH